MKENLKEIIEYLEEVRSGIKKYISDNRDFKNEKVKSGKSWSPGELLEHLHKTEIYITELLKRQLDRAEKRGLKAGADHTSYLHSLDKFEIEIVKEKYNAPEQTRPDGATDPETVLQEIDGSRTELIQLLQKFSEYDMAGMEFPHPAYGRLNMLQWVLFLGKHELRHFNQIRSFSEVTFDG